MKLYLHAISSYRSDKEDIVLKKELKSRYKVDIRRKDDFIFAGLLGALRLKEQTDISKESALYLTSGYGNINILAKMNKYIVEDKESIKLFDFINMLGNTTSFYVAQELGIKAKSIFQISDNFTYFNTLISIYASLRQTNKEVVCGVIDLASENDEVLQRVAAVEQNTPLVSSVVFSQLSLEEKGALCKLEFDTKFYTYEEIKEVISKSSQKLYLSQRCKELEGEKSSFYIETDASYLINKAIQEQEDYLYVECYEQRYKLLKITA